MKSTNMMVNGCEGSQLMVRQWQGDKPVVGALHILHGMAEHALRYEEFATYMTEKGFVVWAHDHRQHGYSVTHNQYGKLDDQDTWENIIKDVQVVQESFRKQYPDVPMTMLGHSMGSLILRDYMQTYQPEVAAAVIMGSPNTPKLLLKAGQLAADLLSRINKMKTSEFLNNLSVGKYNKYLKNTKTAFDWISKDDEIVDRYAKDPMCGYAYNPLFYYAIAQGSLRINDQAHMAKFPKTAILMISGQEDPAGELGVGVKKISDKYTKNGVTHTLKLIQGMRHEILNEVDRKMTYDIVGEFLVGTV